MEFKDVAPLLGVLLPAIAAIFAYRISESRREKATSQAVAAAPMGVVAAITDKDAGIQMASAIEALADALRKGVAIMREEREDQGRKRQMDRLIDEIEAHRREVGRLADAVEKIERH